MLNLVSDYFPLGHLDRYLTKLRSKRQLLDLRVSRVVRFRDEFRPVFFLQLIEKWFAEILDGLLYLWSENVVHRFDRLARSNSVTFVRSF